ncbi:MAG: nucleotide exchange factor GrpE [Roseiflexaceae bacterium]
MTDANASPNDQPQAEVVNDAASLQARIDALEKEVADHKDAFLRATADYRNLKRRYDTERIELIGRAAATVLLKLLPVVDDMSRATASVTPEVADTSWYGGFRLIPQKLQQLLDSEGVTAIVSEGAPFDPNLHEAIAYEPCDAAHDGKVVAELQRGYMLRDKVLRPAVVKVGQAQ